LFGSQHIDVTTEMEDVYRAVKSYSIISAYYHENALRWDVENIQHLSKR